MIEVKSSEEESKVGIKVGEVEELVQQMKKLDNLTFKGLMTIGDPENTEKCFEIM